MKKLIGLIVLMAAVLTACSPYNLVTSTTYNDANLRAYTTFRIVTPNEGKLPPGMEMVTYYNIAAAIREQMVERGFTEDPNSPLLINIGLTIKKELATAPLLPPTPPAAPLPPAPRFHRCITDQSHHRQTYGDLHITACRRGSCIRETITGLWTMRMPKSSPVYTAKEY